MKSFLFVSAIVQTWDVERSLSETLMQLVMLFLALGLTIGLPVLALYFLVKGFRAIICNQKELTNG